MFVFFFRKNWMLILPYTKFLQIMSSHLTIVDAPCNNAQVGPTI